MGGAGRSCLFSQREKIEMRGRLTTTKGYRSPPSPRPSPAPLSFCLPAPGVRWGCREAQHGPKTVPMIMIAMFRKLIEMFRGNKRQVSSLSGTRKEGGRLLDADDGRHRRFCRGLWSEGRDAAPCALIPRPRPQASRTISSPLSVHARLVYDNPTFPSFVFCRTTLGRPPNFARIPRAVALDG